MEAEERPLKIPKLFNDVDNEQECAPGALPNHGSNEALELQEERSVDNAPAGHLNGAPPNSCVAESNKSRNTEDSGNSQAAPPASNPDIASAEVTGLSKSQLKKLRKKEEWEAGREERRIIRKEKNQEKKARKRAARDALSEGVTLTNGQSLQNGHNISSYSSVRNGVPKHVRGTLLPITLIIDCGFDNLMHERERISLGSQITRAYSDNHRAPFKAHLAISSWGGELKERFDTVLNQHYKNWKGVRMLEDNFVQAAEQAKQWMRGPKGGKLAGAFSRDAKDIPSTPLEEEEEDGEVIYLSSDSDNSLDRLKPHSSYIIGGLVDKNRHKGVCYKTACDKGIKTAKLPISEYMDMQSRYVLATNHVVEIMIRWLECGDWGEAFFKVMPKRKGGMLKRKAGESGTSVASEVEEEDGNGTEEDGQSMKEGMVGLETRSLEKSENGPEDVETGDQLGKRQNG